MESFRKLAAFRCICLRGGSEVRWLDECMEDRIRPEDREPLCDRFRMDAGIAQCGRLLDFLEPLWVTNSSCSSQSNQTMFKPMLRSDWKGEPLALGEGLEMFTRSGAAKRFNYFVSGRVPFRQATAYRFDNIGQLTTVNMTEIEDMDSMYGSGGHPGWLGWGAIPIPALAQWLRKREVDVEVEIEKKDFKKRGWLPITSQPEQIPGAAEAFLQKYELVLTEMAKRNASGLANRSSILFSSDLDTVKQVGKKVRSSWTPEEDRVLIDLHAQFGNEWKRISASFPDRSYNAVKNRWEKLVKRDPSLITDTRFLKIVPSINARGPIDLLPEISLKNVTAMNGSKQGEAIANLSSLQKKGLLNEEDKILKQQRQLKEKVTQIVRSSNMKFDPKQQQLSQEDILRAILINHEQSLLNASQRELDRLSLVPDEQVKQLRDMLEGLDVDTRGSEDLLRQALAESEYEENPLHAALNKIFQKLVSFADNLDTLKEQERDQQNFAAYEELENAMLERALRNLSMVLFKKENGRLVPDELDPFNWTSNRRRFLVDVDQRVELGLPTEYDRKAVFIHHEESQRENAGLRPRWQRLQEHVLEQELAANQSQRASIGEVMRHYLEKQEADDELRKTERELFSDKNYDELEYKQGIVVPNELRRRTFNQGGVNPEAKDGRDYGDCHYPYNPSPFEHFVDARYLDRSEISNAREHVQGVLSRKRPKSLTTDHPMPWRQQPYFQRMLKLAALSSNTFSASSFSASSSSNSSSSTSFSSNSSAILEETPARKKAKFGTGSESFMREKENFVKKFSSATSPSTPKSKATSQTNSANAVPREDRTVKLLAAGLRRTFDDRIEKKYQSDRANGGKVNDQQDLTRQEAENLKEAAHAEMEDESVSHGCFSISPSTQAR
eukprot:768320-Hanusia_phi.AAC.12